MRANAFFLLISLLLCAIVIVHFVQKEREKARQEREKARQKIIDYEEYKQGVIVKLMRVGLKYSSEADKWHKVKLEEQKMFEKHEEAVMFKIWEALHGKPKHNTLRWRHE